MLYTTPTTHAHMLQHMDKYSDSFTLHASEESLREAFRQIDRLSESGSQVPSDLNSYELPTSEILGMCAVGNFVARMNRKNLYFNLCIFSTYLFVNLLISIEIESSKFGNKPWWGMFRNYVVYVDRYEVIGYYLFLLLFFYLIFLHTINDSFC
jgi:DNA ligase IV